MVQISVIKDMGIMRILLSLLTWW